MAIMISEHEYSNSLTIDVIIPVYNGSKYIANAVRTVTGQDYSRLNTIIIVNDGSTDDTLRVLSEINEEKNIKLKIYNTSNNGVSSARNYGIKKSKSEIIAFLDVDDTWEVDKLSKQAKIFKDDPECGFVCGRMSKGNNKIRKKEISLTNILSGNFIATSSVAIRRDVLIELNPLFSNKLKFMEDWVAWIRLLSVTKGVYLDEQIGSYKADDVPKYSIFTILHSFITAVRVLSSYDQMGLFSPGVLVFLFGFSRSLPSVLVRVLGR